MRYMPVGIEMGLSVIIGIWLGQKADEYFSTAPVFFWVGLALGIGSATKAVADAARAAKRSMNSDESRDTEKD